MASRNVKSSPVQGIDSPKVNDKMQSSTLKRQPNPDWSKADLLRLLSYFEGELEARDVVIATLKAEKAKQLLYQAKYGRFGLGDPFIALQRDSEGKTDLGFDEAAIKSMYDNQLAQLENLIATQRKAHLKMREQLGNSEKRFHKVCTELEEEKQKHAQDTAQGDDVTYMLEKERERLKAEIDFEKSQNKKLEKDLKKTMASLEEERTNAGRHKQVAIMLIKERKHLIERIVAENQIRDEMETALTDEKSKMQNMAEGLVQESKKTLKIEAAFEKQNSEFDSERESLRLRLQEEEKQTNILKAEIARLLKQLESLQQQIQTSGSVNSLQARSSVSPARVANRSPTGRNGAAGETEVPATGPSSQSYVVDSASLDHPTTTHAVVTPPVNSSHDLEFLGPEMANLQKLIATMTAGEASQSNMAVTTSSSTSVIYSSSPATSEASPSSFQFLSPRHTTLSDSSSDSYANTQTSFVRTVSSPNTAAINLLIKEQNNNTLSLSNNECRSTSKVTAHVFPIVTKPQTIPFNTSDEQPIITSPVNYISHRVVHPTALSTSDNHIAPTRKVHPAVCRPSINFTSNSPSPLHSPSSKRRSIPPRPRSKSPLKNSHNHSRSFSASARIGTSTNTAPAANNTHWCLSSSPVPLLRLSPATEVVRSQIHHLSLLGDVEALHKTVTESRGDVNMALKDGTTPLHCAAESNKEAIMKVLLENGAKPSSLRDDHVTPLHIAALRGYTGCVRLLLSKGASINVSTTAKQTPLHLSVRSSQVECCQLLLKHGANILITGQDGLTSLHYAVINNQPEMLKVLLSKLRLIGVSRESDMAHQVVAITDKDGWTITHMAAHLPRQDCLVMLSESLPLDFEAKDKLGRSVNMIASVNCKELITGIDQPSSTLMSVLVELRNVQENTTVFNVQLGTMEIGPGIGWRMMEDRLRGTLDAYLTQLNIGLKTRRITRLDADLDRVEKDFSLGLTMSNIKYFEIGFYKWTPGMQTDTSPYMILFNSEHKKITITVDDSANMCELIAFDVLHPVSSISNYLRLLEQYKSVIFYGPAGSGKSYLAHRLAQSIAAQELSQGRRPAIHQLTLQPGYSFANFIAYLKQRNCVVPVSHTNGNSAPILLLDNLEMVDIAHLFGELLDPMESRGLGHAFSLRGDGHGHSSMHYLADRLYVIGTMNKSRSLGVDLSVLPRFRWVQFRLDAEPLRGLLARHFFRRIYNIYQGCLPSPDDPVFRAVEWIVCVWQRLNDSLNKLGIPEVVQGPCLFFKCPLEKKDHNLILEWMKNTWNQQIAPRVREAVKRGTGSEAPSDSQQKVANTALYVLMQRSVILSCPLSGQEKDAYFAGFSGSNELDISLKPGESKTRVASLTNSANFHQQQRPVSVESSTGHSPRWRSEGKGSPSLHSPSASAFRMRNRHGKEENHQGSSATHIKRRSLSDSSVNKVVQQEENQQYLDGVQVPSSSQAKMAKLEVKSPKIVSISSAFRSPSLSSSPVSEMHASGMPLRKTGRVSPLLTLVANSPHISQKKSRSSENISGSGPFGGPGSGPFGGPGRLRSPGPFSFSLTAPTSSFSCFKFLDKYNGEGDSSLIEQMPDFSVFDKVPSPTEELSPKNRFIFVAKPEPTVKKHENPAYEGKEKEEEVWNMRTDVFKPIYRPGDDEKNVLESET